MSIKENTKTKKTPLSKHVENILTHFELTSIDLENVEAITPFISFTLIPKLKIDLKEASVLKMVGDRRFDKLDDYRALIDEFVEYGITVGYLLGNPPDPYNYKGISVSIKNNEGFSFTHPETFRYLFQLVYVDEPITARKFYEVMETFSKELAEIVMPLEPNWRKPLELAKYVISTHYPIIGSASVR